MLINFFPKETKEEVKNIMRRTVRLLFSLFFSSFPLLLVLFLLSLFSSSLVSAVSKGRVGFFRRQVYIVGAASSVICLYSVSGLDLTEQVVLVVII
jgi:hypothetical protein